MKGIIESSVKEVSMNKYEDPVAQDVIKAAARVGVATTYNQAFRGIRGMLSKKLQHDTSTFQLILPFLQRFVTLNPGSTTEHQLDCNNFVNRAFICPGFMKRTLKNVRPVMSLDTCHLNPQWKGTL
jgi:hypothetical protein